MQNKINSHRLISTKSLYSQIHFIDFFFPMVTGRNNLSHEIFLIEVDITDPEVSKFQNIVILILHFFP